MASEGGAAAPYQNGGCDGPSLIAHRGEIGDGRNLPENTWQAELDAAAAGVTYLNLDVRWTADAVPVALHDPTVDRTTSEPRPDTPITALTAAQYTVLDARGYAGDTAQGAVDPQVHPDTLAEMLAKLGPTGKPIVLQMEADPLTGGQAGQAGLSAHRDFTDLAQVVAASGYSARVVVAGWTLADLRAFHAVAPYVTLAYLFETIGAASDPTAAQLAAAGTRILYIDYRGITKAKTAAWHSAGLKVWAWTPALRSQWDHLHTDGVDAIATNWSAAYLTWAPQPCPPGAAS
jgi:glycerophosphoryl diester phosphodiesterase